METLDNVAELHALIARLRGEGRRIGLVPTMGNLHAGHRSLIALARRQSDVVVASVFVNPAQFGPGEDFARYPRTPQADAEALAASGCDVLFAPRADEIYPYGVEQTVRVSVPALSTILEGAIRPGHFDGVATVVAKLFNQVQPHCAVFGQKDFQQLLVIRRLVRDLGYPIDIVAAPIVREANGLAMSSRNQYLSAEQRATAGAINATLEWMADAVGSGADELPAIEAQAGARLIAAGLVPDYAVIRRSGDLGEAAAADAALVALIAARLGNTRLIDNRCVTR